MKQIIKLTESELKNMIGNAVNEVIRTNTILDGYGIDGPQEVEYDTEDYYPKVMGRCKLAMDRMSTQIANLSFLSSFCRMAERKDWEENADRAKDMVETLYHECLLPIYKELAQAGIKPIVNGEPYES